MNFIILKISFYHINNFKPGFSKTFMVKFAHLADCHLGGWKIEKLQNLNFESFQKAVNICINEKVDFMLISGDLFDSAYPPIEILKEAFAEFRKIKESNIPVFIIAGSHDFSASGKSFLDVLEKAGFCKNIEDYEIDSDGRIKLKPHIYKEIAIFGYSGKKSGMEIEELRRVYFDFLHQASIFMVHTTISDVVGNIPMESVEKEKLPLADYYAFGHIHKVFECRQANSLYVYPGPVFPNNFQELVDLKCGSFNISEIENKNVRTKNIKIPLREVAYLEIEIDNGMTATEIIISKIDKLNLADRIFLLKLTGTLLQGKTGDINFNEIEKFVEKKNAFAFLRNISSLKIKESEIILHENFSDVEQLEEKIIEEYSEKNPEDFNKYLPSLVQALSSEKREDEKSAIFESRLMDEVKKILNLQEIL